MSGPVGLSAVSVKCTYNISLGRNVFDIREPAHLLIHLPAAFYNNNKYISMSIVNNRKIRKNHACEIFDFFAGDTISFMLIMFSNGEKLTYTCVE